MKIKKYHLPIVIAILLAGSVQAKNTTDEVLGDPTQTYRADDVPAGDEGRYYVPGAAAAKDNIVPSSFSKKFQAGIGFNPTWSMSCGDLNFYNNYKAELKRLKYQLKNAVKKAEAVAMSMVSSAVSGFQQYIMAKINPTLNQLSLKNLDEYIKVFEASVKTCSDFEQDVKNGKNPLSEIAQIAVGDQWKQTIGLVNAGKVSLEEAKEELHQEALENGVTMADGKQYGGKGQPPINISKALTTAGMNLILGRGDSSTWEKNFTVNKETLKNNPILGDFKSVKDLYEFQEEVYGAIEQRISPKDASKPAVNTVSGRGYEKIYAEYRNDYIVNLRAYVNREMNRRAFEQKTGIIIPPAEIDDIRLMSPYQRTVAIEERAQQFAIKRVKRNLIFLKQTLKTGITAPEMQKSGMKGVATKEYKNLYYRIMDDISEIGQRAYQY